MLSIVATNKFGNHCYQESNTGTLDYPNDTTVWTIKTPSQKCIEFYQTTFPLCKARKYNNVEYLMSSQAYEKIPPEKISTGCVCVLQLEHEEKKYFILAVDNKKYLQNPQGQCNENEHPVNCIAREVSEELRITLEKIKLKNIGYYKFKNYNQIINYDNLVTTTIFFANVAFDQMKHLLGDSKLGNEAIIMNARKYSFTLDETQYVIIMPAEQISTYPDTLELEKDGKNIVHTFSGHHRNILLEVAGLPSKYDTSYLHFYHCSNTILRCPRIPLPDHGSPAIFERSGKCNECGNNIEYRNECQYCYSTGILVESNTKSSENPTLSGCTHSVNYNIDPGDPSDIGQLYPSNHKFVCKNCRGVVYHCPNNGILEQNNLICRQCAWEQRKRHFGKDAWIR